MDTRDTLLAAALKVLEDEGEARFSTRSVCVIAKVTAPTLYHHYGSADGLLSAAIAEAFAQFLESKKAAVQSANPMTALCEGWDDSVRFAAARPREFQRHRECGSSLPHRGAAIANEGRLAPIRRGGCGSPMGVCECRIPASRHGPAPQDGAADFCGP